jgi:hypothetical protein
MFNVYSLMLGGYIAMDFETEAEALEFISNYEDKIEAKGLRVTKGGK